MKVALEHPNKESWSAEIRELLGYPMEFDTFTKPKTDGCYIGLTQVLRILGVLGVLAVQ